MMLDSLPLLLSFSHSLTSLFHSLSLLAAEPATNAYRSLEFDWPETTAEWWLWGGGLAFVAAVIFRTYFRDTRELHSFWQTWLMVLRLGAIAGLIAIALNPHERTQKTAYRESRVALVVDTSLSMRHSATDVETPESGTAATAGAAPPLSRAEAIREVLEKSELVDQLRQTHQVTLYTFDRQLTGPHHIFPRKSATGEAVAAAEKTAEDRLNWEELLEPRGLETRLGEGVLELVRQIGGGTLSGVVVFSDGVSNSGLAPSAAHEALLEKKTRLIAVGVGSTESPSNVQIARIVAPTDVQLGDGFELTGLIQAQGITNQNITVELWTQEEGEGEPLLVDKQDVVLPADEGTPAEITFSRTPIAAGRLHHRLKVVADGKVVDANAADDQLEHTVNVFDRPLRVFLLAGGPMRDYQFLRNMLFRHPSIDVDVLLQTGTPGMSQDADHILFAFPDRTELFEYDVIVAFDPQWTVLSREQVESLSQWISLEAGGLILVAGDVNTPDLAAASGEWEPLRDLYPVGLSPLAADLRDDDSIQPRRIDWTDAGREAGFFQLTDDPIASAAVWEKFPGMFRCYPSHGQKAGATIYALFPDPRLQTEFGFPVLMASQFYGEGRILYFGSAEFWLLRAIDEDYYDRLWIKSIREVGQGRMRRGTKRGTLLVERQDYVLGQTVTVRARVLDPQFQPLKQESVALEVNDPSGKPMVPPRKLMAELNRPGEYSGSFRVGIPGRYRLELPIPDTQQTATAEVVAMLPRLEDENLEQDVKALKDLAQDTGGRYLSLAEAAIAIPALLPDSGEEYLVDERLKTLWDRNWILMLLVGVLTLEWLSRKLLKLA
ncbi:MAG: hypothetical protein WEB58_01640 [Planctomycetaceae bacterium]